MNKLLLIISLFVISISLNKTFAACAPPVTPTALNASVTVITSPTAQVTITWTAPGADDIQLQISTNATFTALVFNSFTANDGTQAINGFTCGSTYHIRIFGHETSSGGCLSPARTLLNFVVNCATCSDGIMNQNETGIDCGGVCPACAAPTCSDGVMNQDETGIDCGGVCPVCVFSCNDGIQNGTETGVDCGGTCLVLCNQNLGTTAGTSGCTGAELATIYPTNCDQVGTTAFNTNTPTVDAVSSGTYTAPPGGVSCGVDGGEGVWARYESRLKFSC